MSVVLPQHFTSRFNNWTRVRAILETIGQSINLLFKMLWENTDFIDGAVRSRVFCQLYQYDNRVSGRKDAREQRDRGSSLADRALVPQRPRVCEIGSVGVYRLKSCATLADEIFERGMGGALRQSDKVTRLDLADLSSGWKHVFWRIISGLVLKLTIN
jgi:hypothetical protein